MIDLFYDTETSDLNGHLLQLGLQVRVDKYPVFELSTLVQVPSNISIHPKAFEAHGIKLETVLKYGLPAKGVLATLIKWAEQADRFIAHNAQFDKRILKSALNRSEYPGDFIKGKKDYCTMLISTPICKLPGKMGHKWPKLEEAYKHFVNPNGFDGAHNALADVNACAAIFYKLEDAGYIK